MAAMAASTTSPIVGWGALPLRCAQRASCGTQKNAKGLVLVRVFWICALLLLGFKLRVLVLEGVGDVLQEDQSEDDVLVLGGVHVVAQGVGGFPKLLLEAEVRAAVLLALLTSPFGSSHIGSFLG